MTVWQALKNAWHIKKCTIKDLGIDPNKEWDLITLGELNDIADELEVATYELIE